MSLKARLRYRGSEESIEVNLHLLPRKGDIVRYDGMDPNFIHSVAYFWHTFTASGQEVDIFLLKTPRT
ncbi:hypothetical protein [Aureimonas sp. AU40]|uniref:hypothetical protein n=1 Tax=Aureimonas sp. AU40 TaxID=1637747 RepID=UPI000781B46D|nr:hypothetical protein [Aureimonas sp. AU40]